MSWQQRFAIGGGGALLPILATLLALDIPSIVDHIHLYTVGVFVGTALRYALLFVLGGIVAALNSDESKPIKLVQIGIAAPALIAAYANAQGSAPPKPPVALSEPAGNHVGTPDLASVTTAAETADTSPVPRPLLAQSWLTDVLKGLKGPAYIQQTAPSGLQFNVCVGEGGGPSCETAAPNTVRYTCEQYSAIGSGGPATAPALGERLCKISGANGQQQQLQYSVVHLSSVPGGQCGWTRFVVTCLPPAPTR